MKVVKFGGSSMADAGQYRKIREILLADPESGTSRITRLQTYYTCATPTPSTGWIAPGFLK